MIQGVRACCYSVQRHAVKWWLLNCCKIWYRLNYNTAIFAWQLSPQYWEDAIHSNQITRMHLKIWIWTIRQLFWDFLQDLKVLDVHWSLKCFSFTPLHPTINSNNFFQVYTYKREDFSPWFSHMMNLCPETPNKTTSLRFKVTNDVSDCHNIYLISVTYTVHALLFKK